MMRVLERKGHLKTRREDRAYVYRAARPERQVVRSMVREFVDRVFNGSARPLLVHLVEDRRLSQKELEELERLVREVDS
jgi:predicted transcriptional regulator